MCKMYIIRIHYLYYIYHDKYVFSMQQARVVDEIEIIPSTTKYSASPSHVHI